MSPMTAGASMSPHCTVFYVGVLGLVTTGHHESLAADSVEMF